MTTVLIDTDILIDIALGREGFVENSSKIMDFAESNRIKAFIAWHTISNFYYIVDANSDNVSSLDFIRDLLRFVKISPTSTKDALFALDLNFTDFEDALQVSAAVVCKAQFIITRNTRHYKKSPLPALTPQSFISKQIS